jgi:UDP-glucose 4-epimerase
MKVLVTGGAGYVGSHAVRQLGEAGHEVVVYDDLSTGHEWAVLHGELVVGDVTDRERLRAVFGKHKFDAVLHFAARVVVPESVEEPLKYYGTNTGGTRNLLASAAEAGVKWFIFSSTAAVYGIPPGGNASEATPTEPINPYGRSKLMSEWMLKDLAAASDLRYAALRYFNVAGADLEARIGEATPESTHLIKVACEAALGKRQGLSIFGTDYDTPDGTCVRDYIHVEDIARAHLDVLEHLEAGGESQVLNCGYGHGYSVREVIEAMKRVSGKDFPVTTAPRRPGDPPVLVADSTKIKEVLGWRPQYDDLDLIIRTALAWEEKALARERVG